jgi:hypothetical protein
LGKKKDKKRKQKIKNLKAPKSCKSKCCEKFKKCESKRCKKCPCFDLQIKIEAA